jgi:hypothetical protein
MDDDHITLTLSGCDLITLTHPPVINPVSIDITHSCAIEKSNAEFHWVSDNHVT